MDRIDLITDGAVSTMSGVVDLPRWPEQLYQIKSRIQFPKMREIFFARDKFTLFGEGNFTGTFHMFKGGRELKGDFTSALAGVNDYRFPNLEGSRGLGARSHGGDARLRRLQRRQGRLPLPDGAARQTH